MIKFEKPQTRAIIALTLNDWHVAKLLNLYFRLYCSLTYSLPLIIGIQGHNNILAYELPCVSPGIDELPGVDSGVVKPMKNGSIHCIR